MTWIKICGTTNLEDAQLAAEAGADALGFIFAPSARRIAPAAAAEIIPVLPSKVEKVGVFVNEPAGQLGEMVTTLGLTAVQLHGDETSEVVHAIEAAFGGDFRIIKALAAEAASGDSPLSDEFARPKRAFLLDNTGLGARGGTGEAFSWHDTALGVRKLSLRFNFIIAGGLTPENVSEAIRLFRPWGVDVVSGVESKPGKKDPGKLRAFIQAVREADTSYRI
jgi:phosphoribosylanthranilate isomerase